MKKMYVNPLCEIVVMHKDVILLSTEVGVEWDIWEELR